MLHKRVNPEKIHERKIQIKSEKSSSLLFLLLRLPERLDHNNLAKTVNQLEPLVDDPPAPEQPAAVIDDAGGG